MNATETLVSVFATKYNYVAVLLLLGIGIYMAVESQNLVKKIIGMNIFQTGIFLFFVTSAYVSGGNPPLLTREGPHVSPLPHVLILTAIVVGVALTAVALALLVRIYAEYGTLNEDVLEELHHE